MRKSQAKKSKTVYHSHPTMSSARKKAFLKKEAKIFVKKFSPVIKKLASE